MEENKCPKYRWVKGNARRHFTSAMLNILNSILQAQNSVRSTSMINCIEAMIQLYTINIHVHDIVNEQRNEMQ